MAGLQDLAELIGKGIASVAQVKELLKDRDLRKNFREDRDELEADVVAIIEAYQTHLAELRRECERLGIDMNMTILELLEKDKERKWNFFDKKEKALMKLRAKFDASNAELEFIVREVVAALTCLKKVDSLQHGNVRLIEILKLIKRLEAGDLTIQEHLEGLEKIYHEIRANR